MEATDIPPCFIAIDKDGRWFYQGLEMVRREIVQIFFQHLEMDSLGRYIIHLGGQKCYVDVEDTAFVVCRVLCEDGEQATRRFLVRISDDTQEELNMDTLLVGKGNVLYCKVKDGRFPARFQRSAYYQFAEHVQEEGGTFFVTVQGKKHVIGQAG